MIFIFANILNIINITFLDFIVAHKGDVKLLKNDIEALTKRVNGMEWRIRKIEQGFDK